MCWRDRRDDKELISRAAVFAVKWGDGKRTFNLFYIRAQRQRDSLEFKDREVDLGQNPGRMTCTTKLLICPLTSLSAPVKHKSVITVHIHMQNAGCTYT